MVLIEMVAQQFGRRARDQETDLRARRRGEGAAQQVGDEARRPLHGLERDIARKTIVDDDVDVTARQLVARSEEHTSELQSLMRISYAVFCLKKKTYKKM